MNQALETFSLFLCIAGGLQGAVLIIALNKLLRDKNVERRWLLLFIGAVSITLLGRMLYLYPYHIDIRIPVLTDLILFVYGPLYLFFLKSVFRDTSVTKVQTRWVLHFIPALVHALVTIPLFLRSYDSYLSLVRTGVMQRYFTVIMVVALVHNAAYWIKGLQVIRTVTQPFTERKVTLSAGYVKHLRNWYLGVLLSFAAMIVLYQFDEVLAGVGYQLTWVFASWITYALGYFVMTHPETFGDIDVTLKGRKDLTEKERRQFEDLANEVTALLEEKRIFLDPEISLLSMAKKLGTNNVMLSRTLNQYYQIGFYDLINKYRVEEFIKLASDPANSHFTFYALALQAGFNSKTSFNKYFKKVTQSTPKEYFRKLHVA